MPPKAAPREIPSLSNLVAPILGPDDAAVVVTYYQEPLHVLIVRRDEADRASGIVARYLDELGLGPEYDIVIGTRQRSSTAN